MKILNLYSIILAAQGNVFKLLLSKYAITSAFTKLLILYNNIPLINIS